MEELRRESEQIGMETEFENLLFSSQVRSRSAPLTLYVGEGDIEQERLNADQKRIREGLPNTLKLVEDYLEKVPLYHLSLTMGRNDRFTPHCDLFLSRYKRDYARLGYMVKRTLFQRASTPGPHLTVVDLPEWQEKDRQILVFPREGLTLVLGSDYYGEVKKGFLRMGMYQAKKEGMLGLHAGAKLIHARTGDGMKKLGMVIFGLTATGKTTHSCHNHELTDEGERVKIVQDDVVFLNRDGAVVGTEDAFYIKTDGLEPETQPLLYGAATSREAVLENVVADHRGRLYFQDLTLTGNGRGIINRNQLKEYRRGSVNVPPICELDKLIMVFITRRNTVLPIASKLNPAQAAGAFMLGESIESSGGDPKRAGESVRVVGTNPFIIGSKEGEGNWFYDFLKEHEDKIECYQLNTGGVGELIVERGGEKELVRKVKRVEIPEMARIIRGICRKDIDWREEERFGVLVPEKVKGLDLSHLDPETYYDEQENEEMVTVLQEERKEFLRQFPGLYDDIVNAYM